MRACTCLCVIAGRRPGAVHHAHARRDGVRADGHLCVRCAWCVGADGLLVCCRLLPLSCAQSHAAPVICGFVAGFGLRGT